MLCSQGVCKGEERDVGDEAEEEGETEKQEAKNKQYKIKAKPYSMKTSSRNEFLFDGKFDL